MSRLADIFRYVNLKQLRPSWPLLVLVVFYGYLGFHTLRGSLGVLKLADYKEQAERLNEQIEVFTQKRKALELRAQQLHSNHLNLDRLDEQARRTLNVSHANEIVVWLDETP